MANLKQRRYINGTWSHGVAENANIMDSDEITSKISIMAPYGTIVQLTPKDGTISPKNIMIGANGIYDFDEEAIPIKEICFPSKPTIEAEKQEAQSFLDGFITNFENALDTFKGTSLKVEEVRNNNSELTAIRLTAITSWPEPINYQWQYLSANGQDWYNTRGANSVSYEITSSSFASYNNGRFRCRLSSGNGQIIGYSDIGLLSNSKIIIQSQSEILDSDLLYTGFCNIMKNLVATGITIGNKTKTLSQAIFDYLSLQQDYSLGNSALTGDIYVNYIYTTENS